MRFEQILLNVYGGKIKNCSMFIFTLKLSSLSQDGKDIYDKIIQEHFQLFQLWQKSYFKMC